MTPFQRQVLVGEFTRQAEEEQKMIEDEQGGGGPREISGGHRNQSHSGSSSKMDAVKDSHEERERYVNESVLNNE